MDEEIMQDPTIEQPMDDMTPDEAAASLAFATKISEGMILDVQEPQEIDLGEEMIEKTEDVAEEEEDGFKKEIGKIAKDVEEIKQSIKPENEQIASIRKQLEEILKEDD